MASCSASAKTPTTVGAHGTQISLFDVSDSSNPLRLDKVDIGGASAAEYDHKAFLWWPAGQFTATADYDGTVTVTRLNDFATFAEPVELEYPRQRSAVGGTAHTGARNW